MHKIGSSFIDNCFMQGYTCTKSFVSYCFIEGHIVD